MPLLAFAVLLVAAGARSDPADDTALLQIGGALPKTGTLKLAELEAMAPVAATWSMHGERHQISGVPVERVLTRFGFEPGPMGKEVPKREKRRGWRLAVRASAADGFEAIFSCAEVFESMGATRAMIVWKLDGKPLASDRGPLRLIVLTDKEPSRSIYGLRKLEVIDLRTP
jgi:DMSO/TMAO reductase YedYZ molybdopterin-dependent catalytic subunit